VDDGVATGSTMLAGVHALRQLGPAAVIAAAPVMARRATGCSPPRPTAASAWPCPSRSTASHTRGLLADVDDEVRRFSTCSPATHPRAGPHAVRA
jgi:hypothetical protein